MYFMQHEVWDIQSGHFPAYSLTENLFQKNSTFFQIYFFSLPEELILFKKSKTEKWKMWFCFCHHCLLKIIDRAHI